MEYNVLSHDEYSISLHSELLGYICTSKTIAVWLEQAYIYGNKSNESSGQGCCLETVYWELNSGLLLVSNQAQELFEQSVGCDRTNLCQIELG